MTFKLKRIEWYAVLFANMTAWGVLLQHRFVSLPFYFLFIGLCLSRRWHRRDWLIITSAVAFFFFTFSPVDLYVPGWSGPIFGDEKSGTRLVRQTKGLHSAALHVMRYGGECIDGGCCPDAFNDAKWLLVWDWSDKTNRSSSATGINNSTTSHMSSVTNSDGQYERPKSSN
jgi:hypothetical protein